MDSIDDLDYLVAVDRYSCDIISIIISLSSLFASVAS